MTANVRTLLPSGQVARTTMLVFVEVQPQV